MNYLMGEEPKTNVQQYVLDRVDITRGEYADERELYVRLDDVIKMLEQEKLLDGK
jgi:hypothetical protein